MNVHEKLEYIGQEIDTINGAMIDREDFDSDHYQGRDNCMLTNAAFGFFGNEIHRAIGVS